MGPMNEKPWKAESPQIYRKNVESKWGRKTVPFIPQSIKEEIL